MNQQLTQYQKRLCKPEEIANLTAYLCPDKSPDMTGSLVSIDGGLTAQ